MKIEKIKSVRNEFADGAGPYEIVTLGFKVGEDTHLMGSFYFGPGCSGDDSIARCNRLERFIDHVVHEAEKEVLFEIAHEAHTMGRIYSRMGEPENPAEVVKKLREMISRQIRAASNK